MMTEEKFIEIVSSTRPANPTVGFERASTGRPEVGPDSLVTVRDVAAMFEAFSRECLSAPQGREQSATAF